MFVLGLSWRLRESRRFIKTGSGPTNVRVSRLRFTFRSGCERNATGTVRRKAIEETIDVDYTYAGEVLEIEWAVISGPDSKNADVSGDAAAAHSRDHEEARGRWPAWSKVVKDLTIVLQ
jgi:hypothetical protein